MEIKRGQVYYADLSPVVGSEQGGLRPVVIIQNDVGNRYSPTTIVAALTSRIGKKHYPTSVDLLPEETGLKAESRVLCEQIRTVDKRRLRELMGTISPTRMEDIDQAIKNSFGL